MSPRIYCSFAWYRTRTAAALVASAMLPRVRTGVGCQTHKLPVDYIHVVKFGVIYSVWRLLAYILPILSAAGIARPALVLKDHGRLQEWVLQQLVEALNKI